MIRRFSGHFGKVNVVKYAGSGAARDASSSVLISGSFDSKVMLWDMRAQTRVPIQTLQDARDSITSIATPVGLAEVLVGCVDGCVRAYDLRAGKMVEDTIGASVTSVVASPSAPKESYLAAGLDSTLRLMDRSNGKQLAAFRDDGFVNTSYRSQVAFGYGEATAIAGDEQGRLWIWDLLEAKPIRAPAKIHDKVIMWVEQHPTSAKELLTASADGTIKVWGDS